MRDDPDAGEVAGALRTSIGLLVRRLRQLKAEGELTLPESAVLARLDRGGATTATALAKLEQISPQSMGATLAGLETRGLVKRGPDPQDGRRAVVSATKAGLRELRDRRNASAAELARALASGFSRSERKQLLVAATLLERLAQNL